MSLDGRYVSITPVASSIPFDNSTNGYTATDVQSAIEETNKHLLAIQVSATSNATTTSGTMALLTTMTITASPGTYLYWFSTTVNINNAGSTVTLAAYNNGTQLPESVRTPSPFDGGALSALSASCGVSMNGTVTIASGAFSIQWSTSGGTATCGPRVLNMLRVS